MMVRRQLTPRQDRDISEASRSYGRRFAGLGIIQRIEANIAAHQANREHRARRRQFKWRRASALETKILKRRKLLWMRLVGGKSYVRNWTRRDGRVVFDFGATFGLPIPGGNETARR